MTENLVLGLILAQILSQNVFVSFISTTCYELLLAIILCNLTEN